MFERSFVTGLQALAVEQSRHAGPQQVAGALQEAWRAEPLDVVQLPGQGMSILAHDGVEKQSDGPLL